MNVYECYEILELSSSATKDDIKKSYRALAQKHHPDKGGDAIRFQQLREAYDTLMKSSLPDSKALPTSRSRRKQKTNNTTTTHRTPWSNDKEETREQELQRIFHDPHYTEYHYFTPKYHTSEADERAKRARRNKCKICGGRGFVRFNIRPELGAIGIEERLCSCQRVT